MKTYEFPNGTIVKRGNTYREIPYWCPMISVERSRSYVLEALRLLRKHKAEGGG